MTQILKTTSAIALVLAMGIPTTSFAQAVCGEGQFPCRWEDGRVMQTRIELLNARLGKNEAALAVLIPQLKKAQTDRDIDPLPLQKRFTALNDQIAGLKEILKKERQKVAAGNAQAQAAAKAAADAKAAAKAKADANAKATVSAKAAAKAQSQANATAAANAKRLDAAKKKTNAKEAERLAAQEARRAKRQAARAQERAQSQAVSNSGGRAANVETETLTKRDVRRSSEEFATAVTGKQNVEKDSGLSNFEKALLAGIGAVVVGQVLKNGDEVKSSTGDRVVVEREGELRVLKSDDTLLRRAGNEVSTETFDDGSSRTTVVKPDGTRIVTILGADGTVLRRLRVLPDGQEYVLVDDTKQEREIVVKDLPKIISTPLPTNATGENALRAALLAEAAARRGDAFSLRQVRDIRQVRELAPEIELDAVRFASGSAAIEPEQARSLARIGNTLREIIAADPRTVLLVEGHTDAVGDATYNLALSDRRAETVALALTEYFGVAEENMIVQGYGESYLKIPTLTNESANRRAVVRNITELLR